LSEYALSAQRRGQVRRIGGGLLILAMLCMISLAGAPMAYMLWPRWPDPVRPDAPSLPISIGGVVFNLPPAAIRVPMQRRPGTQPRVDLAFLWPSLAPPDPATKPTQAAPPNLGERIFVTIAGSDGALPPAERLKMIYPRYVANAAAPGPDGLVLQPFRNATPYQGEDLIYDPAAPERFLLRCTRKGGLTPGMCLHERRIGSADVTVRFPREGLADWQAVASGIERLIASFNPTGT
jgi:hypothetical protein